MKRIIISMFATAVALSASAVVTQRVYLKNGSVLNGYIMQQDKNDNISFRSESAVISADGRDTGIVDSAYSLSELSPEWIEWAEKNNAFNGSGDSRTLTLSNVTFDFRNRLDADTAVSAEILKNPKETFETNLKGRLNAVSKVRVLEKGAILRYVELSPNSYTFNWSDVETIKADKRAPTMLSGINRTYILKNGREVSGQYAGETYNTLSLYDKNGLVETFDINDVTKYVYSAINPNQDIFEQSPLLDIVSTKNQGLYRGIIVERNFGKDHKYLMIRNSNGDGQMLKFSDITNYSNEENPNYKPIEDIILDRGVVMINRVRADSVGVTATSGRVVLDSINTNIATPLQTPNTKIVVEYRNEENLSPDHLILVKVDKTVGKKKKNPVYSFSTDIFQMQKFTPIKSETSVNHTTRTEYVVPFKGVYALYDMANRKAMPFVVR